MVEKDGQKPAARLTYKVIILGDTNVGKSSLFLRYTQDRFKEAISNTIGVNNCFKDLVIEDNQIRLHMWDTAGQERFRSIVSCYYRESDGFILVYDLTRRRSFDYMRQLILDLSDSIIPEFTVIVGNKADCLSEEQLLEEAEQLKEFATEKGLEWRLSSAKTGQNVSNIFENLAAKMYYNRKKKNSKRGLDITKKKRRFSGFCFL